ncbi:MAG: hybrid sensor histidine kinase/response regulator [Gloeocapsa sp. UFS-A4-WI-NPMV-4B04]|jgi:two-component system sensor histidine kinase/response regulator|nr:hybrid sensor histidine kinase/response regulator [Gloeocapsa sp. UFS-A4-WI-NPMV-4B04]
MQPDIKGNILLVDDTPDNLRLLSTMLTEQGYEVRSVINGAMALMGVQAEPPDLILLDINMPQMNGYEVCQQLKAGERTREIPVIFISALEDVLDKVKAFAVGGVDYITKPFHVEEVLARIENQLTICRLQKQLKLQNAQLQQQMLELQELNSLKEEFLHAVSHDLRTPIMGTLLVLKNLQSKSGATVPISRSILERMIHSSDRQLNLLNSLLEAHSNEMRGILLCCEPVQLNPMIQDLTADLEPLLTKNQVKLINLVPLDLPFVNGDPLQLRRVFENLLTNALSHNPPGLTLTLKAIVEEEMIYCTVEDNGVGIERSQCDLLFERYVRGSRTRSIGVGLGLYLCRQIITAHGGQIGVNSKPGTGTTFWLTLPLVKHSTSGNASIA